MKASEVIAGLVEMIAEHGDCDVCILESDRKFHMSPVQSMHAVRLPREGEPAGAWYWDDEPDAFWLSFNDDE